MSPESDSRLRIIGRDLTVSTHISDELKYHIHSITRENTIPTVFDTIELSSKVKSESKLVMNLLPCRDILSPGKFDFVSISNALWRGDDRMPLCRSCILREMMKSLSNLSLLYLELSLIRDWEPLAATIDLIVFGEFLFVGRRGDRREDLSFEVIFFHSEDTEIDSTLGDGSTRDDDPSSVGSRGESRSAEDEFLDSYV